MLEKLLHFKYPFLVYDTEMQLPPSWKRSNGPLN